jgi:hypothetical protein
MRNEHDGEKGEMLETGRKGRGGGGGDGQPSVGFFGDGCAGVPGGGGLWGAGGLVRQGSPGGGGSGV